MYISLFLLVIKIIKTLEKYIRNLIKIVEKYDELEYNDFRIEYIQMRFTGDFFTFVKRPEKQSKNCHLIFKRNFQAKIS